MKYLSVCSGIEAATVAWHPLGWEPIAFSEIEPFPAAVLQHRWPEVPNLGDMTLYETWKFRSKPDVLVGGTPCQSFSLAGLRKGLESINGQLMLTYVEIAAKWRPKWLVWENVPGCLTSNGGTDFAAFLGALTGRSISVPKDGWKKSGVIEGISSAYGIAWRVLDSQYFGVAQRRRRVFVIGYLGDWRRAAAVLFEQNSLCGNPPPSREESKKTPRNSEKSPSENSPIFIDRAAFNQGENALYDFKAETAETAETLVARGPHAVAHLPIADIADCLQTTCGDFSRADGFNMVPCRMVAFGEYADDETASTIKERDHKDATDQICCVHGTQDPGVAVEHAHTLGLNTGQENAVCLPIHDMATRHAGKNGNKTAGKGNGLGVGENGDPSPTLTKGDNHAVAFDTTQITSPHNQSNPKAGDPVHTLNKDSHPPLLTHGLVVRRLTPVECEILQGFPAHHTLVPEWTTRRKDQDFQDSVQWHMKNGHSREDAEKYALHPDGHRYKACGNSMAVPCMRWLGERIEFVEKLTT